ncbi:MAG: hypothetical protein IMF11_01350, partial [Proteobacteria bacterium]|nr:hypothetical protein [Pseudomonadota bacterium]
NIPTQEDEIVNQVTYDHGEFDYHLISALLKQAVNGGAPVNADTTGNGLVSMLELFNYVEANDNVGEHPQYDDGPNNIGGNIYIEEVSNLLAALAILGIMPPCNVPSDLPVQLRTKSLMEMMRRMMYWG